MIFKAMLGGDGMIGQCQILEKGPLRKAILTGDEEQNEEYSPQTKKKKEILITRLRQKLVALL
jgi:hypothetical protein